MRHAGPVLLVLVLLASSLGVAGEHLSVGVSGTTVGPREHPQDPSVGDGLHRRGTETDCPAPDPTPIDPGKGLHDAVCGELVYHEGTDWEVVAPKDQDLRGPIGTFDVRRSHDVGTFGLTTCQPWCLYPPATFPLYDVVNNVAWKLGVSSSDWADEADRGNQEYGGSLQVPHALSFLQATTNAGDGDGWMLPSSDHKFVGILRDKSGNAVTQEDLREIVSQSAAFDDAARPIVCGYLAGVDLTTASTDDRCEVPLQWAGADGAAGDNPCQSRAYVCGVPNEGWHGRVVCPMGTPSCEDGNADEGRGPGEGLEISRDPTDQVPTTERSGGSLTDVRVWHFVVAPTGSECMGGREPGFDVQPAASLPYLAHDLDIYATPDSGLEEDQPSSLGRWAKPTVLGIAAEASQAATQPAWQDPQPEPNHEVNYSGAQDTSKSREIPRDWTVCRALRDPGESRDRFDPWVNVVDARMQRTQRDLGYEGTIEIPTGLDGERGRTGSYVPTGRVVYAADSNDDGAYQTVRWAEQFDAPGRTGIYPLFWDMRVTDQGDVDLDNGCPIYGGVTGVDLNLTESMAHAGYRSATGIVQAVALDEPVAWEHRPSGNWFPFPTGGVFLLASQAPLTLGLGSNPMDPWMADQFEEVGQAAAKAAGMSDPSTYALNPWLPPGQGEGSGDYQTQCGEQAGGFTSIWTLHRACPGAGDCAEGASVTRYIAEVGTVSDGFHDHAMWAKPLPDDHDAAFPTGRWTWTDVDRLGPS